MLSGRYSDSCTDPIHLQAPRKAGLLAQARRRNEKENKNQLQLVLVFLFVLLLACAKLLAHSAKALQVLGVEEAP